MSLERITKAELLALARQEGYVVTDADVDVQGVPLRDPLRDAAVNADADGVHLTHLADVVSRRARFAWEGRIPLGELSIIAGLPGQGKSTLTAHLGARISRGQLAGDLYGAPADVVIATAEDAIASVLKPRFLAAGGDLERVHSVSVMKDGSEFSICIPDDLPGIERALLNTGARLLVIDPFLAHLPLRLDSFKDQHVRQGLAPLSRMAEDLDCAVVCVAHLNKRESADLFSRVGGSGGILAAARSALLVAEDPEDTDSRIIAHGKSNLSELAGSLRFRLEGCELDNPDSDDPRPIKVASVAMIGESDSDVAALLGTRGTSARADATGWLAQQLARGPMEAEAVESAARVAGYSARTLRRAKEDLGVRSEREGGLGENGHWRWTL